MLLKEGRASPKRNKLGVFFIQLTYEQEASNQPLVLGIDPGSKFEGYSVVGLRDTVLNLMAEAPAHVKEAIETRRAMRRARRFRKWRRPRRFNNRLNRKQRIPPSTRSCWEAKARIVAQLTKGLPITTVALEDVQATTHDKGKQWHQSFSPVQCGKLHLYRLLTALGLHVELCEGWQAAQLREQFGLKKVKAKETQVFESHCVDAWVLAAWVSGAQQPTCRRLWYSVPLVLHRRQLHRLQASKGGERKPYGGTRSLGLKRGTLARYVKYGVCSVGGCDRKRGTISLHTYRTNKWLPQGAKPGACQVLTSTVSRSWLVRPSSPIVQR
jgi:RRXRR protein